jgi:hypothetical protein
LPNYYLYKNNHVKLKPKKDEKLSFYLMIMVLSLCAVPTTMLGAEKVQLQRSSCLVQTMLNRLEEIKEMDKSSLNSSEKKNYVKKFVKLNQN